MKTYSLKDTRGLLVAALFAVAQLSAGHSWPEETQRIAPNGTFVGSLGYPRKWIFDDKNKDQRNEYQVNAQGIQVELAPIVKQEKLAFTPETYSPGFMPMLNAAPGDWVAIKYNENGHVSLPETLTDKIKPINRGTIYLYGTNINDLTDVKFGDVHGKWTPDGTGGNKKGRLLATRHYDDGQCYEFYNDVTRDPEGIKGFRNTTFPVPAQGPSSKLMCQSDIKLPDDIPIGQVYTILWVWDWPLMKERGVAVAPPTFPTDPSVSTVEIYTGIVDIKIVDHCDASLGEVKGPGCSKGGGKDLVQFEPNTNWTQVAIRKQMENLFMVKMPDSGKPMKDGVNYNSSDIPFFDLVGVQDVPFPLPKEWMIKALNRHNEGGPAGATATAPSATQPASSHTGGGLVGASSSTAPAPTSSATQTGGPPAGGGIFLTSAAPAPATSAPALSASQASTSAPTSILATASQVFSVSAPASINKPTGGSGQNLVAGNTKFVIVTQTISMPATTVYITETTTTTAATATIYETAHNQTTSAPKFRRGKGQWGFVSRN
ncbi:hypothetical protein SMACR_05749 [Sordaria macrospora]|uniref:WGS project CABT00000000 data, contig 2.6 n=2 Tax=Sordaria macrospora TaxID=5147 RepID=F7VT49_SORMK|nr:uncharacterized protein SMAC_05749 [Sordaria macrospora k-hell]KAA8631004.1 hypothetical protein SMACR_05749 [Sordaria macrospora]KAH7626570.1 hypothetical protein B0T09DRAFT_45230 [Sordaria sp. MPI-SDFR-AT-0083]WPJ57886.1 hypothetical protein SMAC4_05749 [Sordaria macrospora]CCC08504.1 unnamed protein product [Sordaria macrospora k-hell]